MHDEELDPILREYAKSYNAPPTPDVELMWTEIEHRHFHQPTSTSHWWNSSWMRVAAALVIGVGVGRITTNTKLPVIANQVGTPLTASTAKTSDSLMVPVLNTMNEPAKLRYLGQTVALLASVQGDASSIRGDAAIKSRASDLLLTTRLMLDSQGASDPNVQALLEDLELVLVQIVQMPPKRNASDVDLIKEAMEQRDVMPRLIAAVSNTTSAE
jgi:hypothetical protein